VDPFFRTSLAEQSNKQPTKLEDGSAHEPVTHLAHPLDAALKINKQARSPGAVDAEGHICRH
jgi:hypothetical protein